MATQLLGPSASGPDDAITKGYADARYATLASPTLSGTTTISLLKVTGGSPGANKVLTSDASGNASWATQLVTSVAGRTGAVVISQGDVTNLTTTLGTKADLDGNGKIPQAQLPAIALTEHLGAVASQAAMLALVGQRGDWCTRTDTNTNWTLIAEPSSSLSSWLQHTYPTSPVASVAGRTGAVTLSVADVSGAAPLASPVFTGLVTITSMLFNAGTKGEGKVMTSDSSGWARWDNPAVTSVAGKTGAVVLDSEDIPGLVEAMAAKADLVGGKVPEGQIPVATETNLGGILLPGDGFGWSEPTNPYIGYAILQSGPPGSDPGMAGLPFFFNLFQAFSYWTSGDSISIDPDYEAPKIVLEALSDDLRGIIARGYAALQPIDPVVTSGTLTTPALKVTGGTPGAGKVLTSDASGNGTWQSSAGAVSSVAGKTGAVTLAKADVGLGSVDNTADLAKPVSTAQQTALNGKANALGITTGVWSGPSASRPAVGTTGVVYLEF
ncbi:structural protein [Rhodococcus phage E3]|uniref:structural protein n=1 Tax=Rhodococcus phage E3 TaxID=1007869 RepID=UPI0002C6CAAF|nr:structural protein [Rhodococcus phage E3]AEQ21002.1 structural protein [Rhodococcus phage E3]